MNRRLQIIIFVLLCLLGIAYAFYQNKQLESNYSISTGEISEVEYLAKGSGYFVSYTFPEKESVSKSSICLQSIKI